jgi:hypothetical protein
MILSIMNSLLFCKHIKNAVVQLNSLLYREIDDLGYFLLPVLGSLHIIELDGIG